MIDWKDCKVLFSSSFFFLPSLPHQPIPLTTHKKKGVSWGVALLLAAGYALASAFTNTGLSNVLGSLLSGLGNLPLILGLFCGCLWLYGISHILFRDFFDLFICQFDN